MGQYSPAANKRTNPWDFVLLIEGAMLFAAAATRRFESAAPAVLAFPFHARAAGGLGTVVESDENESRDELWLPLWGAPATLRGIRRLFAEGRATVGAGERAHTAATALDFARAVTALGVDRGIDRFTRIGFHVRNGLSYYATPLGRFETGEVRAARLLDDVDAWFDRFRHKASAKNTPGRVALARRQLEQAMFDAVTTGSVGAVLIALGAAEQALARSLGFTSKAFLPPVPRLPSMWAAAVADGSIEHRLASALAARPGMRSRLVPLDRTGRAFGRADDLACVFNERPLVDNLHALLHREEVEAQQIQGEIGAAAALVRCSLSDIAQFIEGRTDDALIESWLRGLVLIEDLPAARPVDEPLMPPAAFSVLALAHHRRVGDLAIPRTPGLVSAACAGDAIKSTTRAMRRLRACGRSAAVAALVEPTARMRRIAAALAFPLTRGQLRALEAMVFPAATSPIAEFADSSQEQA